jgi:hypothetical protein
MDLTFFHAHGADAAGRQRAINIDGWLLPSIGSVPPDVTMRYRHVDDEQIHEERRKFGRLQKNFRLHGRMVQGTGYARYRPGDLMLMRITGDVITWAVFQNAGDQARLFAFLSSTSNLTWRRNMGLVQEAQKIRALELLLTRHDAALFFADEIEALEAEPTSRVVRRLARRAMTPEAFAALQDAWERNGRLGEDFVLRRERQRLTMAGRPDLAARVVHVSMTDPTSPFDVLSFEGTMPDAEAERYLEVKATSGTGMEFEMSEAEWQFAEEKRQQHILCRVTRVTGGAPECQEIRDIVGHHGAGGAIKRPIVFSVKLLWQSGMYLPG